ncbi:hypothetical protein DFH06DRAFT_1466234 [Mycena polygramma]|nr:hypothetical protein DFH06DRAFT_1466234 [Mycena polygramma]
MANKKLPQKGQKNKKAPAVRPPNVLRCPSSTPAPSHNGSAAGPSRLPALQVNQVTFEKLGERQRKHNTRGKARRDELESIAAAQKKRDAKARALPPLPMAPPPVAENIEPKSWVHVGNLDPLATVDDLTAHFARCGELEYVNIRYSATGIPGRPENGYRYAIVKFTDISAVNAALALSDSALIGSAYRIVVKPDLLRLPEVQRLPEYGDAVPNMPALFDVNDPELRYVVPEKSTRVQTGSGTSIASPTMVRTRVWKPDVVTKRERRKAKSKQVVVGGVTFTMTIA